MNRCLNRRAPSAPFWVFLAGAFFAELFAALAFRGLAPRLQFTCRNVSSGGVPYGSKTVR